MGLKNTAKKKSAALIHWHQTQLLIIFVPSRNFFPVLLLLQQLRGREQTLDTYHIVFRVIALQSSLTSGFKAPNNSLLSFKHLCQIANNFKTKCF